MLAGKTPTHIFFNVERGKNVIPSFAAMWIELEDICYMKYILHRQTMPNIPIDMSNLKVVSIQSREWNHGY